MKIKLFIIVTLIIFTSSCNDFLERDIIASLSEENVIQSYDFSRSRVNAVYIVLPEGFNEIDGAMAASASDEAEHTYELSNIQKFNTGAWNAYDNPDNVWYKYYRGIRKANQFLLTADSVNLEMYRLDPDPTSQTVYNNRLEEINRWKYEVRFLRAYFYFELVKRYGGVPIITEVFSLNDDVETIKRDPLSDCIQFIVKECEATAAVLPTTYGSTDLGRATKGAALALKSRVLLYAASDLFNTVSWAGGYDSPQLISMNQDDRVDGWKSAADAAKAVIDLNDAGYGLHKSYPDLFKTFNSSEIIFTRRNGASNSFERANFPVGYDLGQSGTTPSQNLVDAYEVKESNDSSVPFDWSNPAHANSPYLKRDPRLAFSVLLNNTTFKGRPVEAWIGGRDGKGQERSTRTGYYLRKYVDDKINLLTGTTSIHSWILIRLAEIYLNYAEALNEYDPGNPDINIYINKVRARSGVAMPSLPSGLSQEETRNRIRTERRVEFAFEGHRLWDLRRWMLASDYLGVPLRGVEITKIDDQNFNYTPIKVEDRVYEKKMNLYPIPQMELLKAKGLVQNPLW